MKLPFAFLPQRNRQETLPILDHVQQVDIPNVGTLGYREGRADGRPLVFVHGTQLSSGPHELRPLRAAFADRRTYALDWPGYGVSSLPSRGASANLYADSLIAFIENVIGSNEPVDVVAVGRGGEFAALAAIRKRNLIRSLALLSPTGFGRPRPSPKLAQLVRELQRTPRLSRLAFRALTTWPALLYVLSDSLDRKHAEEFATEAHRAARRPGASAAPMTFLQQRLAAETADATLYLALRVPTYVLFGHEANADFELLPLLTRDNAFIRSLRVGSRHGAPHFESTPLVESALREYYQAMDVADRFADWESTVETVPFAHSEIHAA
jgi:pimeloyl-ACP methyl ester carboxylesterase